MKRILTKATAFFSAVVMMSGTLNILSSVAEDEKITEVKVVFNITDDMTAGAKTDVADFESFVTDSSFVSIPKGVFTKDGYVFSGWTDNGIDGYLSGDSYNFSEGMTEVVFEPVWFDPKNTDVHNVIYSLDYRGETFERPEWLKDGKAVAGQIVTPNYTRVELENAISYNLILGDDHILTYDKRFVMPDYDVVINHEWVERVTFTYYAGDVDRLNGNNTYSFSKFGKTQNELAGSDRFSRDGFELIGWLSDYDGEIYKPLQVITAPETDVIFTAVWSPKTYNVLFRQGNGGQNIKVEGVTDTEIICPEPDITVEGKYFAGWQDTEGNIYPAGSKYTVLGAKPGSGIVLNAVWNDGEVTTIISTTVPTTSPIIISTTTETVQQSEILGDANLDGKVTIADATAIIQALGNSDEYALSEQGEQNADIVDRGDGVTGVDANAIQAIEAGFLKQTDFPITKADYDALINK